MWNEVGLSVTLPCYLLALTFIAKHFLHCVSKRRDTCGMSKYLLQIWNNINNVYRRRSIGSYDLKLWKSCCSSLLNYLNFEPAKLQIFMVKEFCRDRMGIRCLDWVRMGMKINILGNGNVKGDDCIGMGGNGKIHSAHLCFPSHGTWSIAWPLDFNGGLYCNHIYIILQ